MIHASAFSAIIQHCGVLKLHQYTQYLHPLLDQTKKLLTYNHDWVRYMASEIFGHVFACHSPSEVVSLNSYMTEDNLSEFLALFYEQLEASTVSSKLADQIVKNLLYVSRVLDVSMQPSDSETKNQSFGLTLQILRKLRTLSMSEQTTSPKETTKRSAILKYLAAYTLTAKNFRRFLTVILEPIHRCLDVSVTFSNEEIECIKNLHVLANEVMETVRKNVEHDLFTKSYLKVTQKIGKNQRERKRKRNIELITNPEKSAAIRVKKQQKTKRQRKNKANRDQPDLALVTAKRSKTD